MSNTLPSGGTTLTPFPAKGKPTGSRIADAETLRSMYWQMLQDDVISGGQRFAINQQINGAQPYLQTAKKKAGAVGGSNLNFGEASARIRQTLTTYNDMLDPLRAFIEPEIPIDLYDDTTRQNAEDTIAEEFTTMVRDWQGFESRKQLLSKAFVTHGVALAYFPKDDDWKFDVAGMDNFLIPRSTRIGEENVDVLLMTKDEIPSAVYKMIEDEAAATEAGWDVEATKQALVRATNFAGKQLPATWGLQWDVFSKMVKGNDLGASYSTTVRVYLVHAVVKEYDGSYSHYITERNPNGTKDNIATNFLYKRVSYFPPESDPFTIFCLNVGDGEYHSVRGQGYDQFAHVQTSNKMLNDLVNQFRRGSCTMLKKKDTGALDEAPIVISNGMAIISPEMDFVEQDVQDHTRTSMPVLDFFSRKLDSVSPVENGAPAVNGPVMTKYQLQAVQGTGSALNTSAINMFNRSWKRLLREMWRRVQAVVAEDFSESAGVDNDMEFPEVEAFVTRCARRGVTVDMVLQVERVNEVRAVGAGSPQMQQALYDQGMQLMPTFDEQGRAMFIHDDMIRIFGNRRAQRYFPLQQKPRPVIDQKVAELENSAMFGGGNVPPLDGENHTVHATVHLGQPGAAGPDIATSIQILENWRNNGEQGDITDLQPHIAFLSLIIPHCEQHVQAMAADPTRAQLAATYKKALQEYAATWMTYMRQLQKALDEQKAQEEQQAQPDPVKLQKVADMQQKMNMDIQRFQQSEQLKVADIQSRIAIRKHESDVKTAIAINKASAERVAQIPQGDPMALELPPASRSDDVTNRSAHTPNV